MTSGDFTFAVLILHILVSFVLFREIAKRIARLESQEAPKP